MNPVRALNEADIFPTFNSWPLLWKNLFVKRHKNNNERYRLFAFFYLNGMEPFQAKKWVLIHGGYDFSAQNDLHRLARGLTHQFPSVRTKFIENLNRNRVYDFNLGRVN